MRLDYKTFSRLRDISWSWAKALVISDQLVLKVALASTSRPYQYDMVFFDESNGAF